MSDERSQATLRGIIKLAHTHGWNGVTNAKDLTRFLQQRLEFPESLRQKYRKQIIELKQLASEAHKENNWPYYNELYAKVNMLETVIKDLKDIDP